MNNTIGISMKKLASVASVAMMLIAANAANAEIITFDDLPGRLNAIPNGYGGLQWNNFGNTTNDPSVQGTGYETGIVSGLHTAFNLGGSPAGFSSATAFTLNDAFFTGAWNDGLQIHVIGTGGSNIYTSDFTVDTSGPIDIFFNWSNINSVMFFSAGGVPNPGLTGLGLGTHFVMDNLAINQVASPVPEPRTYAMLLAGLGFVGFMSRRRKSLGFSA